MVISTSIYLVDEGLVGLDLEFRAGRVESGVQVIVVHLGGLHTGEQIGDNLSMDTDENVDGREKNYLERKEEES